MILFRNTSVFLTNIPLMTGEEEADTAVQHTTRRRDCDGVSSGDYQELDNFR